MYKLETEGLKTPVLYKVLLVCSSEKFKTIAEIEQNILSLNKGDGPMARSDLEAAIDVFLQFGCLWSYNPAYQGATRNGEKVYMLTAKGIERRGEVFDMLMGLIEESASIFKSK